MPLSYFFVLLKKSTLNLINSTFKLNFFHNTKKLNFFHSTLNLNLFQKNPFLYFITLLCLHVLLFPTFAHAVITEIPGGTTQTTPVNLSGATNDALIVDPSAVLSVNTASTNAVNADGNTAVYNAGTISDGGNLGNAIFVQNITAGDFNLYNGITATNTNGTITVSPPFYPNATIVSTAATGSPIRAQNNGNLFIQNYGQINGSGINSTANATTITNFGSGNISAPINAVNLTLNNSGIIQQVADNALSVTNQAGAVITNGVSFNSTTSAGTLNNQGTIGGAPAVLGSFNASTTVTNSGTINGDITSGGSAVNPLIVNLNGGSVNGNITGAGGINDTVNVNANQTYSGTITNMFHLHVNAPATFNNTGGNITGLTTLSVASGASAIFNTVDSPTFQNNGTTTFLGLFNGGDSNLFNNGNAFIEADMIGVLYRNNGFTYVTGARTLGTTSSFTQNSTGYISFSITNPANFDSLTVANNVTINGGTLAITTPNGISGIHTGDTYNIINGGAVTGNFNNFAVQSALLSFSNQIVGGTTYQLTATVTPMTAVASTKTSQAVAQVLGTTPALAPINNIISNLPTIQAINNALQTLQPTVAQAPTYNPHLTQAMLYDNIETVVLNNVFVRFLVPPPPTTKPTVRAITASIDEDLPDYCAGDNEKKSHTRKGKKHKKRRQKKAEESTETPLAKPTIIPVYYLVADKQDAREVACPYRSDTNILHLVLSVPTTQTLTLGGGLSYARTHIDTNDIYASRLELTNVDDYQITATGTYDFTTFYADAMLSLARSRYDAFRCVVAGGFEERPKAKYFAWQNGARLSIGKYFQFTETGVTLIPSLSLEYSKVNQQNYFETDAPLTGLACTGSRTSSVPLSAYISLNKYLLNKDNKPFGSFEVHGSYIRELYRKVPLTVFQFLVGTPFIIAPGVKAIRDAVTIGGSYTHNIKDNLTFSAGYDYLTKRTYKANSGNLRITYTFK